jgi:diaminopimelate epimerase
VATETRFEKYEGLGNDFIVLDSDTLPSNEFVRGICDRHFGVGADGVLVVGHPANGDARARMTVLNADGSRPEMCGNGLRCVGLHLARLDELGSASYAVETDAGVLRCEVQRAGDAGQVVVDIGRAELLGEQRFLRDGDELVFRRIRIGNPHAVLFDHRFDLKTIDEISEQLSRAVDGGVNVEFVRGSSDGFDLVVWERGVGRTLACGTGAGASVVALAHAGRAPFDRPVRVTLPGGPLLVTVTHPDLDVRLQGPARRVFSGYLDSTRQTFRASPEPP